ncbi:hypothetical protein CLV51_1088 [Chitinophaga niastensis]|uniref:Uncharacterized protein n=1 Tax=Chitinophaga niastensis TaxID=536980 RepID=A0A2P8HAV9_CHINA|nr:hypothetical protein [Chitinophaga niastensis]PSL43319.1 hypothetical protein CLV51_1088 [Chitinophaga niastensis]
MVSTAKGSTMPYYNPFLMTLRHQLWLGIVFFHLLLAVLNAAHMKEWGRKSRLVHSVNIYGYYSGAGNIYSFFAPGLAEETEVIYTLADAAGHQRVLRLENNNHEHNLRIQTIYTFFGIREAKDLFLKCTAAYMFDQHRDAVLIRVLVLGKYIPSMYDFRRGQTCRWRMYFYEDFAKKDQVKQSYEKTYPGKDL